MSGFCGTIELALAAARAAAADATSLPSLPLRPDCVWLVWWRPLLHEPWLPERPLPAGPMRIDQPRPLDVPAAPPPDASERDCSASR